MTRDRSFDANAVGLRPSSQLARYVRRHVSATPRRRQRARTTPGPLATVALGVAPRPRGSSARTDARRATPGWNVVRALVDARVDARAAPSRGRTRCRTVQDIDPPVGLRVVELLCETEMRSESTAVGAGRACRRVSAPGWRTPSGHSTRTERRVSRTQVRTRAYLRVATSPARRGRSRRSTTPATAARAFRRVLFSDRGRYVWRGRGGRPRRRARRDHRRRRASRPSECGDTERASRRRVRPRGRPSRRALALRTRAIESGHL